MQKGQYMVGEVRQRLGYASRAAMQAMCAGQFDLPEEHAAIDLDSLKRLLFTASQPRKGRSAIKVAAAVELLKEVENLETRPIAEAEFPVPVEEPEIKLPPPATDLLPKLEKDGESWPETFLKLSKLDLVFYINMSIAVYGLAYLFKEMGLAAGMVYSLISAHALGMAKDRRVRRTAELGLGAIWALETATFFVHLFMFNNRIWAATMRGELPFRVEASGENSACPFTLAAVMAAMLSASAIYAVTVTLATVKEGVDAEQFEAAYGQKY